MSTNPKSIYNEFIRANLPVGITYDEVRAQYVTGNGKRFPTYLQAKWYLDYIIKFGYSPVFSVASLFSDGEAGAWYDPSDLSTLFQDTAGTTPVTTSGQTVGLVLDKSQGLTLGSELVDPLDFEDGSWSIAGTGTITGASTFSMTTNGGARGGGLLTEGKTYRLTLSTTSTNFLRLYNSNGSQLNKILDIGTGENLTFTATFKAENPNLYFRLDAAGNDQFSLCQGTPRLPRHATHCCCTA